jgi:hypothetical protein
MFESYRTTEDNGTPMKMALKNKNGPDLSGPFA